MEILKLIRNLALIYDPRIQEDLAFVRKQYKERTGRELDLLLPKRFNEKMQWLKLFDRKPIYTKLADKYGVREYVKERVGKEILNEVYGVYTAASEIDFDNLPQKFVISANHGSEWNILVRDKSRIDIEATKKKLDYWLGENFYEYGKEFCYRDIKPRILISKYLETADGGQLIDYKFYCFHGKVKFMHYNVDRWTNLSQKFHLLDWTPLPYLKGSQPMTDRYIPQPPNFQKMIEISEKLSAGLKYCRVDLYDLIDKVVFGEITFYPGAGYTEFKPDEANEEIGSYLNL